MILQPLCPNPLVTFAVLAYNSEQFIEKAVEAAFSQEYPNLEIVLSDDGSDDSTFNKMELTFRRFRNVRNVRLSRNASNIGLALHVNQIFRQARGSVVVLAAGDDVSLPSRVGDSISLLHANPHAASVSFSDVVIDQNGTVLTAKKSSLIDTTLDLDALLTGTTRHPSGASRAYRREVFDMFGPLNETCPTEDTTLMLRSLFLGTIITAKQPGIQYRRHSQSLTGGFRSRGIGLEEIQGQYHRDLATAQQLELLDGEAASAVGEWIDKNFRARSILREVSLGGIKRASTLSRLTFSPRFTFREKYWVLSALAKSAQKRLSRRLFHL